MAGFDALEVEQTSFKVFLEHPITNEALVCTLEGHPQFGKQAFIEVDGYNSEAGEPLKRKFLAKQATRGQSKKVEDPDKLRVENAENVSALTRTWFLVDFDGNPIEDECNRVNAKALYANKKTAWIVRQVLAELAEEANFIQAS